VESIQILADLVRKKTKTKPRHHRLILCGHVYLKINKFHSAKKKKKKINKAQFHKLFFFGNHVIN